MHRDVVIVGYRLNAKEPAAKALERILGLAPDAARKLARGFPAVVLKAAPEADAERISEQLQAAGALVELRVHAELAASARPANDVQMEAPPARTAQVAREPVPPDAGYQLGDFGFGQPKEQRVELPPVAPALGDFELPRPKEQRAQLPVAPAPAPGDDLSLDLELAGSMPQLELEGAAARPSRDPSAAREASGLHALGDRFDSSPPSKVPQVEERAFRAIQRVSRGHDSRRPLGRDSARPQKRDVLTRSVRAWLSSVAMLFVLSAATAAAVGYALDPTDLVGALQREGGQLGAEEQTQHLHPLLRAAPRATRPALAAILRARIAGVHQLPVSYQEGSTTVQCTLVEHAEGQTDVRLAELRETGREVTAPPAIAAQLHEHGRALRSVNPRSQLELTPLCLAL